MLPIAVCRRGRAGFYAPFSARCCGHARRGLAPSSEPVPQVATWAVCRAHSPTNPHVGPLIRTWAAPLPRFSPRQSVLWEPHPSHSDTNRGIALHEAPTRRRHAVRGLHVVQNPPPFPACRAPPHLSYVATVPAYATKFAQHATPPLNPRKNSPSNRSPRAQSRKSSPSTP